jgi:hypothetical protein
MQKTKKVYKGMCLALAAFFLVPYGSFAEAATPTSDKSVVTSAELYNTMSARVSQDDDARKSVQKILDRSEVRLVAARTGLDLQRAQAAVSVLSGEELQAVTHQAQRVDEALSGGSSVVVTSTMVIIGLLVLIVILVAN